MPKTEPLREKLPENTYARHHATIKDPLKNISAVYSSKQLPQNNNNTNLSPQKQPQPTELPQRRAKLQLGQSSHKKSK